MSIWHFACHGHTYEYHYPTPESMVRRYSCASMSCFGGTKATSTDERQSECQSQFLKQDRGRRGTSEKVRRRAIEKVGATRRLAQGTTAQAGWSEKTRKGRGPMIYKMGRYYRAKFMWQGELIRKST